MKLKMILLIILIFLLISIGYFFVGSAPRAEKIIWGVNFSQKQAENLGLDWKETYSALLDDLKVKNIKLITQWDLLEPAEEKYNFDDLDWQIQEAEKKETRILLVIGRKTGRWPECHIPEWAENLGEESQQKETLKLLEKIVLRYRERVSVWAWQVENEPFFSFGECPKIDKNFVKKEVELVKSLDSKKRPVIISDSGEWSFWIEAAKLGDIAGTTMYRRVWFSQTKTNISYPLSPVFYWRKAQIIRKIFNKEVIVVELQAEPWAAGPEKVMDLRQFKNNIEFAQKTGLSKFYLWGEEWWYWLKEKQNQPEIWNEAQKLF